MGCRPPLARIQPSRPWLWRGECDSERRRLWAVVPQQTGGNHGPWNSSLASRRPHSDHHPSRPVLALRRPMTPSTPVSPALADAGSDRSPREAISSAVAWPAVWGGALVAVAMTILLLALGSGIGLASTSPWSGGNPSPTTFTIGAAIWLIVVQWISSGLGGYLTGRMRTKWVEAHSHEVFLRDTANGLLTWAIASVVVVGFAVSAGTSALSGAAHTAATVAGGAASSAGQLAQGATQPSAPTGYLLDTLF